MPLRPYQERQSSRVLAAFAAGRRRVLDQMPTGAGKTYEGAHSARVLAGGEPSLWIAHRDELLDQAAKELRSQGATVEIIRPDERPRLTFPDFFVCSIQTLHRRALRPRGRVLVLDEARHYVAPEWGPVVSDPIYRDGLIIGLDATPMRSDGAALDDLFDALIQGPQVSELINPRRYLMPARHVAPEEYNGAIAETAAQSYLRDAPGTSAILYVESKAAAMREADKLRAAGCPAEAITDDTEERDKVLDRFRRGITAVLVNVFLLTEGVDLPVVETVGIYRGCQSLSAYLQMLGRGGRPALGKRSFTVLDACGLCWRPGFGWYDDEREWGLTGTAHRLVRRDGEPEPAQCRGRRPDGSLCLAWVRPPRCPVCGSEVVGRPRRQRVQRRPMGEVARAANAHRDAVAVEAGEAGLIEQWIERERLRLREKDPRARTQAIKALVFRAQGAMGGDFSTLVRRAWRAYNGEVRCV